MSLTVRAYTDADRLGFAHVRSRVYREGAPVDPAENLMRSDTFGVVGELNGKIVAAETEIDMTCTVRGQVLPCAGVAAVGVLPEFRRGGLGLEMLAKALPIYRERGHVLASLIPFRAHYYRKVGYATCGSRFEVKCPAHRLPQFKPELDVWELPSDDYSAVVPCYNAFAKRYSGMNLRNPEQWIWQLGGDNRFAIYAAGNPVEAYVSVRLRWEFWEEMAIRDFAWTTLRGYEAMVAFFRGLCMNKTAISWHEPSEGPALWRYDDQGIVAKLDGQMMYRIVDVPKVLQAIRSEGAGEFTVAVEDPHLPENRVPGASASPMGKPKSPKAARPGSPSTFSPSPRPRSASLPCKRSSDRKPFGSSMTPRAEPRSPSSARFRVFASTASSANPKESLVPAHRELDFAAVLLVAAAPNLSNAVRNRLALTP